MERQTETRGMRPHIGLYGVRNAGKSSLLNALTDEHIAVVSDIAGTTTDPVLKNMELHGYGAVTFMDTAGFDDTGELGQLRVEKTLQTLEKCDLALFLFTTENWRKEVAWWKMLAERKLPRIALLAKNDLPDVKAFDTEGLEKAIGEPVRRVSIDNKDAIDALLAEMKNLLRQDEARSITGDLVKPGDRVLLVVPQDIQAPKGRLIVPQVQTIRELLDKDVVVTCVTFDQYAQGLAALVAPPNLIITDSQVFSGVYAAKPPESKLTSFSVLFAAYKGDMTYFSQSTQAIANLKETSRVLIAEACSHPPLEEDIGRVKIPALLRKRFGENLHIDFVRGNDFPADLSAYDLIIHCGACMFNRRHVLRRSALAEAASIPMTNYGLTMAYLQGILDKVVYPT